MNALKYFLYFSIIFFFDSNCCILDLHFDWFEVTWLNTFELLMFILASQQYFCLKRFFSTIFAWIIFVALLGIMGSREPITRNSQLNQKNYFFLEKKGTAISCNNENVIIQPFGSVYLYISSSIESSPPKIYCY